MEQLNNKQLTKIIGGTSVVNLMTLFLKKLVCMKY